MYNLFFCKKILGQDQKSGHLLEIKKKKTHKKHFLNLTVFLRLRNCEKMARWSDAEDIYICNILQRCREELIDYTEKVADHNRQFEKDRTEVAYKVHVKKIAKDANIPMRLNSHNVEDEKYRIVQAIQANPLTVNWTELSTNFHRTEAEIKRIYHEKVSAKEQVERSLECITEETLEDVMRENAFECVRCKKEQYSLPKKWEEFSLCEECHIIETKEKVQQRWIEVNTYATQLGKNKCTICAKPAEYNREVGNRFHFDHVNMFEKGDSICMMVLNGTSMEKIKEEICKCEVACVSCHRLITAMERKCGFIRLKQTMTCEQSETTNEMVQCYKDSMQPIYAQLRKRLQK